MIGSLLDRFVNVNYKTHLLVSLGVRLALVTYGMYHDQVATLPYTDVDYKVFTDAARHVLANESPYNRHTYRYSPLLAYLVIPNVLLHEAFGKILFCLIDLVDALLIKIIIKTVVLKHNNSFTSNSDTHSNEPAVSGKKKSKQTKEKERKCTVVIERVSNVGMLFWLYNPLTMAISTRGNCDSIAVLFVLATLYLLQCQKRSFLAGLVHGLSVHFRLYPLIYSLSFFMYLSKFSVNSIQDKRKRHSSPGRGMKELTDPLEVKFMTQKTGKKTIFQKKYLLYLVPNFNQLCLVLGCFLSLASLTLLFYYLYGGIFLFETYIYHFVRRDTRHNFSLYFYLQYLTAWVKNIGIWPKSLVALPQLVLLIVLSFHYGLNKFSLNFAILTQTIVMVTYNSVLTSQYFVWIMAVLPLCLWQIKMTVNNAAVLGVIWLLAQGAWLLPAYFLEFHGQNMFLFIWIQSVSFFCANIAILGRMIMFFVPMENSSL